MDFEHFYAALRILYDEMMPLCSQLIGLSKGLAGLGAMFYIAYRIWQSLAKAEPIDVFPLLRPFAVGLCIMYFPTLVLGTINSIMSPVVQGTHQILESQTLDMQSLAEQKDIIETEMKKRNPETAYLVDNEEFEKKLDEMGITQILDKVGMHFERAMYDLKKSIQRFFREVLEILFQAASLVIDVIRTFFLIVLSVLGPLAFAIAVFDGFQSTLTQWITRYISVYLWLPVCDLYSTVLAKLQTIMLQSDIDRMMADPNYDMDASDLIYILFLIIGFIGYFTIPTVAGWIISAGGGGNFGKSVTMIAGKTGAVAGGLAGAATGNMAGGAGKGAGYVGGKLKSGFKSMISGSKKGGESS